MTNDRYLSFEFEIVPESSEMLIADLVDIGFDGFSEAHGRLTGFVPEGEALPGFRSRLDVMVSGYGGRIVDERIVEPQNWNAEWESTVRPIVAGRFCIHPPWAEPEAGYTAIRIEPKMSFGTGHHETTRLMLEIVADLVKAGDAVLDAGTGTGVLAIASLMSGAARAEAFDVESWAVENAVENATANGVSDRMEVKRGGMEVASQGPFDLICANINRNVLLDMMPRFVERLDPRGHLALAGVLETDREVMLAAIEVAGLRPVRSLQEGEWLALVAERV